MASPVLVTGALDPEFGTGGTVVTDFSAGFDTALSLTVQSDGKFVAVGSANGSNFGVARYNADGTLDTTFSSDGKVATDFSAGFQTGRSVVIQPDGKILAVGDSFSGFVLLARYNADGSFDTSFSSDGKVSTFGNAIDTTANDVALQSDGKILVAGSLELDASVLRYNADGTLDTGFD